MKSMKDVLNVFLQWCSLLISRNIKVSKTLKFEQQGETVVLMSEGYYIIETSILHLVPLKLVVLCGYESLKLFFLRLIIFFDQCFMALSGPQQSSWVPWEIFSIQICYCGKKFWIQKYKNALGCLFWFVIVMALA
jgi:hypothetical protein